MLPLPALLQQIGAHYERQVVAQIAWLIASLDILVGASTILGHLGTAVEEAAWHLLRRAPHGLWRPRELVSRGLGAVQALHRHTSLAALHLIVKMSRNARKVLRFLEAKGLGLGEIAESAHRASSARSSLTPMTSLAATTSRTRLLEASSSSSSSERFMGTVSEIDPRDALDVEGPAPLPPLWPVLLATIREVLGAPFRGYRSQGLRGLALGLVSGATSVAVVPAAYLLETIIRRAERIAVRGFRSLESGSGSRYSGGRGSWDREEEGSEDRRPLRPQLERPGLPLLPYNLSLASAIRAVAASGLAAPSGHDDEAAAMEGSTTSRSTLAVGSSPQLRQQPPLRPAAVQWHALSALALVVPCVALPSAAWEGSGAEAAGTRGSLFLTGDALGFATISGRLLWSLPLANILEVNHQRGLPAVREGEGAEEAAVIASIVGVHRPRTLTAPTSGVQTTAGIVWLNRRVCFASGAEYQAFRHKLLALSSEGSSSREVGALAGAGGSGLLREDSGSGVAGAKASMGQRKRLSWRTPVVSHEFSSESGSGSATAS